MLLIHFALYRLFSAHVISAFIEGLLPESELLLNSLKVVVSLLSNLSDTQLLKPFFPPQSQSKIYIQTHTLSLFPDGKEELFVKVIRKD